MADTEPDDTVDTAAAGAEDPQEAGGAPGTPDGPEAPEDASTPRNEASKLRERLRTAEAALATANERVAAYQRSDIERQLGDRLLNPPDFWTVAGKDTSELLDEDGDVDAAKVSESVDTVLAERPHWAKPAPKTPLPRRPRERLVGGGRSVDQEDQPERGSILGNLVEAHQKR